MSITHCLCSLIRFLMSQFQKFQLAYSPPCSLNLVLLHSFLLPLLPPPNNETGSCSFFMKWPKESLSAYPFAGQLSPPPLHTWLWIHPETYRPNFSTTHTPLIWEESSIPRSWWCHFSELPWASAAAGQSKWIKFLWYCLIHCLKFHMHVWAWWLCLSTIRWGSFKFRRGEWWCVHKWGQNLEKFHTLWLRIRWSTW